VLLIAGDRDHIVPMAHTEMLRAALPSAGLVVLEGCGHVPGYTHPEAFAEVIRQFLTPPAAEERANTCVPDKHSLPTCPE
jgi:pimeloyl-ACP methyl ester carboxylesterase